MAAAWVSLCTPSDSGSKLDPQNLSWQNLIRIRNGLLIDLLDVAAWGLANTRCASIKRFKVSSVWPRV